MSMSETALTRRLANIKVYPSTSNLSDAYLTVILNKSYSKFMAYTKRITDHEEFDEYIVDIALKLINREGVLGTTSASEGGVSRSWEASMLSDVPSNLILAYQEESI